MFPGIGSKVRYLVISGIFVISVITAVQNLNTFSDRKVDTLIFFLVSLGIFSVFFGGIFF